MNIRIGEISDVDRIIELGNTVKGFKVSDKVVNFWPEDNLRKIIQENMVIVAEEDETIVGFSIINYNPAFGKAIIENIFVKEEFMNKGIGGNLVDATLDELKKIGCGYVCAITNKNNEEGIEWFENQKFTKGIDCVWMDRILSEEFKK